VLPSTATEAERTRFSGRRQKDWEAIRWATVEVSLERRSGIGRKEIGWWEERKAGGRRRVRFRALERRRALVRDMRWLW
jgi:hypothetical protein